MDDGTVQASTESGTIEKSFGVEKSRNSELLEPACASTCEGAKFRCAGARKFFSRLLGPICLASGISRNLRTILELQKFSKVTEIGNVFH